MASRAREQLGDSARADGTRGVNSVCRTRWGILTVASALLVGAWTLLSIGAACGEGPWGADYFPNVPLTTQDGATVWFYDDLLKGKAVAINLVYTTCKYECPLATARLLQVQKLLADRGGKDLFFYSISIDPKPDTPEVLKAYAKQFGAGPSWLFLTGKDADIKLIARKMGLSSIKDVASRDGHRTSLMVGHEPTGQWMKNSAVDNPQFLAATISPFLGWRDEKPKTSYAEARPLTLDKGWYLFRTRCLGCHTIGKGDVVGPDLAGVMTRRDRAWLARYLTEPDRMLA